VIRTSSEFVEWLQYYFAHSDYIDVEEIAFEVFDVVEDDSKALNERKFLSENASPEVKELLGKFQQKTYY